MTWRKIAELGGIHHLQDLGALFRAQLSGRLVLPCCPLVDQAFGLLPTFNRPCRDPKGFTSLCFTASVNDGLFDQSNDPLPGLWV